MQNINLLDSLPGAHRKFLTAVTLIIIIAVWTLALLLFYVTTFISVSSQQAEVRQLQKDKTISTKQSDIINATIVAIHKKIDSAKMADSSAESAARSAIITALQQRKTVGFVRYFSALAQNTPKGVWLTSFSFSANGKTIILKGNARYPDLVPDFIHSLSLSKAFKGSKFHALELSKIFDHYAFVLRTEVNK